MDELSPAQTLYLTARMSGKNIKESSELAGVGRKTGTNWEANPAIKSKLEEMKAEVTDLATAYAASLTRGSFETLAEIRDNPEASDNARINSAKAIINGSALLYAIYRKESKLRELEALFGVDD